MAARLSISRRQRLALLPVALGLFLAAAWFLWHGWQVERRVREARRALESGDLEAALPPLETAAALRPDSAEVAYLLAVAHRRLGRPEPFKRHLERARSLGWRVRDAA